MTARPGLDVERLYDESFSRVSAFAYRLLGDRDAALDVAQESFVIALDKGESFRGESAPLTWLLSITRNLCLVRLRRSRGRRFEDIETVIERGSEPPSASYSAVDRAAFETSFPAWKPYYLETEVRALIPPAEAMRRLSL